MKLCLWPIKNGGRDSGVALDYFFMVIVLSKSDVKVQNALKLTDECVGEPRSTGFLLISELGKSSRFQDLPQMPQVRDDHGGSRLV